MSELLGMKDDIDAMRVAYAALDALDPVPRTAAINWLYDRVHDDLRKERRGAAAVGSFVRLNVVPSTLVKGQA